MYFGMKFVEWMVLLLKVCKELSKLLGFEEKYVYSQYEYDLYYLRELDEV